MTTAKEKFETKKLPMMPIRDVVIFPYMMTPFVVGRESSVRALEEALTSDKKIFLATQHDASVDEPKPNEIYQVGTIVRATVTCRFRCASLVMPQRRTRKSKPACSGLPVSLSST